MSRKWTSFIMFLAAIVLPVAAMAAPPQLFEGSLNLTIAHDICLKRAADDLRKIGFNVEKLNLNPEINSVIATNGDFTAFVRCQLDAKIVIFIVAGPNSELKRTQDYAAALRSNF